MTEQDLALEFEAALEAHMRRRVEILAQLAEIRPQFEVLDAARRQWYGQAPPLRELDDTEAADLLTHLADVVHRGLDELDRIAEAMKVLTYTDPAYEELHRRHRHVSGWVHATQQLQVKLGAQLGHWGATAIAESRQ